MDGERKKNTNEANNNGEKIKFQPIYIRLQTIEIDIQTNRKKDRIK